MSRSSWPETVALILRDMDPEARLEFLRSLGSWKRISQQCIDDPKSHPEDRDAAERRLVKLGALEEHLEHEVSMMQAFREACRRWMF